MKKLINIIFEISRTIDLYIDGIIGKLLFKAGRKTNGNRTGTIGRISVSINRDLPVGPPNSKGGERRKDATDFDECRASDKLVHQSKNVPVNNTGTPFIFSDIHLSRRVKQILQYQFMGEGRRPTDSNSALPMGARKSSLVPSSSVFLTFWHHPLKEAAECF